MLKTLARGFFAASLLLVSEAANASWPDRPVTLIVPYAAGGITDVLARTTAEYLQTRLKQTFIVQNETGAGGIIGAANVARAKADGTTIDWVVLRNRLAYVDARNMRRVSEALDQLSRRVGFRIIPGLGERVIYRELFPAGLTLLDNKSFGGMGLSHVAARQELREMMAGFALPETANGTTASSAAA